MFCPNCGKDVSDGSPFCDGCGYSFTNNGGGYQDQYQYSYQNSFSSQPGSYKGNQNRFGRQNPGFATNMVGFNLSSFIRNYINRLRKMSPLTFILPIILLLISRLVVNFMPHFILSRYINAVLYNTAFLFSIIVIGPVSIYVCLAEFLFELIFSIMGKMFNISIILYLLRLLILFTFIDMLYIVLVEINNVFIGLREKMYIVIIFTFNFLFHILAVLLYFIHIFLLRGWIPYVSLKDFVFWGLYVVLSTVSTYFLILFNNKFNYKRRLI